MTKQLNSGAEIFQKKHWEHSYGSIPKGWKFVPIGSIFIERKETAVVSDKVPLFSLTIDKGITLKTERYERGFLLKEAEKNKFSIVKYGDFVFNPMNLRFGAIAYSRESKKVTVSGYYNVLILKDKKIDIDFLESYLRCHQIMGLYNRIAIGSLIEKRRIHLSILNETYFALPSPEEQLEIGNIIRKLDNYIALKNQLLNAKQEIRKGLMQVLLTGKLRFSGHSKKWRTIALGEVFNNRTESGREDLPLLSITGDGGVVNRDSLAKRDTSKKDKSRYLRICPGDIGYNTMRMWQGVNGLSKLEGIVSPAYTVVTPDQTLDVEFIATFFKFPPIINLFRRHSQGLVDDTLNLKYRHFSEIKVTIPEKDEQIKIVSVFKIIDQELRGVKQQLDFLKVQKKGLMQQLMTGKKRTNIPKIV